MPAPAVLSHLKGIRGGNGKWTAKCPAHDDRRSSLSVSESQDGKVLLHCHAGCSIEQILEALELEAKDLFSDNGSKSEIIATYDYTDEDGKLLYQVVRFFPKDFRQRRPDGAGGYIWSLGKTRRVLYRLPQVLEAVKSGRGVLIVEGEKDVHRLEALGFVATTNAGGAAKWRPEYSESLRGANVVILPDYDAPGHKHAETVRQSLEGVAASVKVLHLPGLQDKQDVSDWIKAGGTAEELRTLIKNAPESKPSHVPSPRGEGRRDALQVDCFSEWDEPDPMRFVIEDFIPRDYPSLLYGDGGQGKSYKALHMAMCVVTGTEFLGKRVEQGTVLYVDFELDQEEQARRAYKVARGLGLDSPPEGLLYFSPLTQEAKVPNVNVIIEQLAEVIREKSVTLSIIDSFGAAVAGDPESARDVTDLFRQLRQLGTALVLDHQPKGAGEKYRDKTAFGSVYKQNMTRNIWQLQRNPEPGDNENEVRLALYHRKSNFGPLRETIHLKATFGESFTLETTEPDMTFSDSLTTEEQVLAGFINIGRGTALAVSEETGIALKTVRNKITTLKSKGKLVPAGTEKDSKAETYRPFVPASRPPIGAGRGTLHLPAGLEEPSQAPRDDETPPSQVPRDRTGDAQSGVIVE